MLCYNTYHNISNAMTGIKIRGAVKRAVGRCKTVGETYFTHP